MAQGIDSSFPRKGWSQGTEAVKHTAQSHVNAAGEMWQHKTKQVCHMTGNNKYPIL